MFYVVCIGSASRIGRRVYRSRLYRRTTFSVRLYAWCFHVLRWSDLTTLGAIPPAGVERGRQLTLGSGEGPRAGTA